MDLIDILMQADKGKRNDSYLYCLPIIANPHDDCDVLQLMDRVHGYTYIDVFIGAGKPKPLTQILWLHREVSIERIFVNSYVTVLEGNIRYGSIVIEAPTVQYARSLTAANMNRLGYYNNTTKLVSMSLRSLVSAALDLSLVSAGSAIRRWQQHSEKVGYDVILR